MEKAKSVKAVKAAAVTGRILDIIASPVTAITAGAIGVIGEMVTFGVTDEPAPTIWALVLSIISIGISTERDKSAESEEIDRQNI